VGKKKGPDWKGKVDVKGRGVIQEKKGNISREEVGEEGTSVIPQMGKDRREHHNNHGGVVQETREKDITRRKWGISLSELTKKNDQIANWEEKFPGRTITGEKGESGGIESDTHRALDASGKEREASPEDSRRRKHLRDRV